MMSDHWKSLTRLLGAPSAAEPPEPKQKTAEAKPAGSSSPAETSRAETSRGRDRGERQGSAAAEGTRAASSGTKPPEPGPQKDPLKAILETPEPTTLPGFGAARDAGEDSSSSWDALVKDLNVSGTGSETAEAEPIEGEAETGAAKGASPRDPGPPAERKPARQSGGFGAGLGLDLEPEAEPEPKPERPERETRERATAKPEVPGRPSRPPEDFDESEEVGFGGPRRRRSGRGAPRGHEGEETFESVDERVRDRSAAVKARSEDGAGATDDEGFGTGLLESDAAGPVDRAREEDEERASSRTRRPRGGRRRGVRQRVDEMDKTVAPGGAAAETDEDAFGGAEISSRLDEEPTVRRAEPDTEEDEDGGPRRRRRRRRRRGGGDARPDAGGPAESRGDEAADEGRPSRQPAIEATFDDDYEDAEEVTEMRRGRGRRRGRRGAASGAETGMEPAEEAGVSSERRGGRRQRTSEVEDAESPAKPRPKYRDVVTWADTVDVLVSSNMEKRKREPQRGRGARNGRSGRNGSRKRE